MRQLGSSFPWPLRALGRGFLTYGHVMSMWITFLMMSVVYWLILPFFTFLKLGDPMRTRFDEQTGSYWDDWRGVDQTVERYRRPF